MPGHPDRKVNKQNFGQSDSWKSQSYLVHSAKSTNHRIDHNNHSNKYLSWVKTGEFPKWKNIYLENDIVSIGDICSRCFFFFRKLYWLWLIGNRTSCRAILSVIILVINESDSRFTVVRFCWSLVWLQTELDSIQSYYHYLSCNALEWMIMTMKKNKQSIYLVRGLAKHSSTKSKFGLKRNSCGNST